MRLGNSRKHRVPVILLLAALVGAAVAVAQEPGQKDPADTPETWEVWYSVQARLRGARANADLEAGGRLAMVGSREPAGTLHLSLHEVIEHPWKLYWVNPWGPFGEEVKMASVVTLPEASWTALESARRANTRMALARHQNWSERTERTRGLDGSFAFVVIGAASGRFQLTLGPDGLPRAVSNRMTDRWLSGPFDQFIGSWGSQAGASPASDTATGKEHRGYWFWNNGEERPFDYQPHTYHALAAAIELLALALPQPDSAFETDSISLPWQGAGASATRVLEILAPRADLESLGAHSASAMSVRIRREQMPGTKTRQLLFTSKEGPGTHIERETVFSSEGWPLGDRIRVNLVSKNLGNLEVEVGYRRQDQEEESK